MNFTPESDTDAKLNAQLRTRAAEMLQLATSRLEKMAVSNALRQLHLEEQHERGERDALSTADEAERQRLQQQRQAQHEALAQNLDRHNRLEHREATVRQTVRRDTHELRELQAKLNAAYVGQGLRVQLAEHEAQRLREKLEDEKHLQQMLVQRQLDAAELVAQRTADKAKKLEFRHVLLDQMAIKARWKQRRYEDFLREKRDIDAIVQRFYEESVRELAEKQERKQRFRNDLQMLREQHDAWSEKERRELDEENARIERYLKERDAKEEAHRQAIANRRKAGSDLAERLGAVQVEAEQKRLERQKLLEMLHAEELEEQAAQQARDQLATRLRRRLAARTEFVRHLSDRAEREQQRQLDERQFRAEQLQRLAEQDRLEQLSDERRRQRLRDHHRIVLGLLEERRKERAQRLANEMVSERAGDAQREQLQQNIEEERIKMLQENAERLGGCFPRGILRESDRAQMNL